MENQTENDIPKGKGKHGASVMYILLVGIFFAILTVVFLFFPRSTYSELEKRDLAEFPDISDIEKIKQDPAKFTSEVSSWFSDTEPYRDELMTMSMKIRDAMKADYRSEEETVSFRPADNVTNPAAEGNEQKETAKSSEDSEKSEEETESSSETDNDDDDDIEDGKAKLGSSGTIIIGKGENVRALMAFGGTPKGGGGYVDLLNTLANEFPNSNVYAMVAPLATEYYLPAKAAKASNPQKPFIYSIRDRLSQK